MSLIIRKLALYEQQNQIEEEKRIHLGYMTRPIDENLRNNVIDILEKIKYPYEK